MIARKNTITTALDAAVDVDDSPDLHRNAPRPGQDCLYGLIGEIATAGSDATEANPYAIALTALTYLCCAVGRGPYMPIGNTWHHARIFGLHVGRSGEGRKGDAVSLVKRIAQRVRELDENLAPQIHSGGLSSREGMVFMIHDGYREGKEEIPAIEDKRLWVIESEFANVLAQGKRDGNTLSPALRDAWDGTSLQPATKSNRLWATHPHICLSGAITPSELRSCIATRDLTNGFMNRLFLVWAERHRKIPFPVATSAEEVNRLAERVAEVLRFCGADRWVDRDSMRVRLSQAAAARWSVLYMGELNDRSHGERLNALIERRAPMLLRIAMLFAATDMTTTVEEHHIDAALAWVRYSTESTKFIFATACDEAEVSETNEMAAKILQFVRDRDRVTRSQITSECFAGHATKTKIDVALDELLSANPPRIRVEEDRSKPGRPTKFYELSASNAKQAKNKQRNGFAADSDGGEISEPCELAASTTALTPQLRTTREQTNQPETRASIDSSPVSPTSQAGRETCVAGEEL